MTRAFHAYVRPASSEDRAAQLKALEAFASQLGAPPRTTGDGSWRPELRVWEDAPERPTLVQERPYGAQLLRQIADGAVLLVPSLADLADIPSDLDALLRAFVSRGIALYVLELPGQTGASIQPAAAALAAAFRPLEDARSSLETELAAVQRNAEARLDAALQVGLARMAENWGLPFGLRVRVPPLGDVQEPARPITADMGEVITQRRKELGLSQVALAKQIGISQPVLSRIETTGAGESLPVVLDFLFGDKGGNHEAST